MTLADLRRAAELLPPGSSVMVPREALLAALEESAVSGVPDRNPTPESDERWLTADEVATMLQTSTRWCYDHAKQLGAKKLSRRCVRFNSRVVERFMGRRHD